jgi:hypothetical protein
MEDETSQYNEEERNGYNLNMYGREWMPNGPNKEGYDVYGRQKDVALARKLDDLMSEVSTPAGRKGRKAQYAAKPKKDVMSSQSTPRMKMTRKFGGLEKDVVDMAVQASMIKGGKKDDLEIQLSPNELEELRVQLSLNGNQTSVVKDASENEFHVRMMGSQKASNASSPKGGNKAGEQQQRLLMPNGSSYVQRKYTAGSWPSEYWKKRT